MNLMLHVLFWIAVTGSITSAIYCLMVLFVAERFWRRRRRDDRAGLFLPPVSILKPLHGMESGLERNLASFFEQDYPEFELLFCARYEIDEGLRLARDVGSRYPNVRARYLTCGEPQYPNAKMYSVKLMAGVAEHEVMVSSDADARVERDFLRRVVQPLADDKIALTWCPYLGTTNTSNLTTRLDAVGKSVEMGSGVLVADLVEGGTKFALGVSMVLRRKAFDEAGGFEDLGQFPAEDYVIGNRLAAKGKGVLISPHVIRLMVPDTSYAVSFKNQLRWMQSTRRSRPMGHLGTALTFSAFRVGGIVVGCFGRTSGRRCALAAGKLLQPMAAGGSDAWGAGRAKMVWADVDLSVEGFSGWLVVGFQLPAR